MAYLHVFYALTACCAWILVYMLCLSIYRIYLSPVAKFPGRKLPSLTYWYEFYYDIIKNGGGLYIWEVEKMHKTYGPIIRVSPYELHVNDPAFFDEIYANVNRPRDKYDWRLIGTTSPTSFAFTTDHNLHRLRREPVQSYFSRKNIISLESVIQEKVETFCRRLDEYAVSGKPINLSIAFTALTVDIISQCCFAVSFNYLEVPDFEPGWRSTVIRRMKSMKLLSHIQILSTLLRRFPRALGHLIVGDISAALDHKRRIRFKVISMLENQHEKRATPDPTEPRTIFKQLLESRLPPEEKTIERLTDEGAVLLGAGSETVAKTLGILNFHLMVNPDKRRRLISEIATSLHNPSKVKKMSWASLEKLPYLTAVIKEGLRLHHGLAARNVRIAPDEDIHYQQWTIPAGTPISSIPALIHLNPEYFPEPREFLPERWLQDDPRFGGKKMPMLSFGKGSRSCLGINLAYAELYVTLATMVMRFDLTPYKTTVRDVDMERDFTIPTPQLGSVGVRATVKSKAMDKNEDCKATET